MKTAIPSVAQGAENPAKSSHSPLSGSQSGRLGQLAAMMNQSPRVLAQLKLARDINSKMNDEPDGSLVENSPVQAKAHPLSDQKSSSMEWPQGCTESQTLLQRKVEEYKDDTEDDDMPGLANLLDTCVQDAKGIVDSNPLLTSVPKRTDGYLGAWVECFNKFLETGNIPDFFYARYGYAIETLATAFFHTKDHKGYKVSAQVTQGSTRPDLVISKGSSQIAWLDITSSSSVGHIKGKQGGGWSTRPYVAEILYAMPNPTSFATSAKGALSEEQQKVLKKADEARALRELQFDKGMRAMGLLLGNAYQTKHEKKGEGLSRSDVREVTSSVCKEKLDGLVDKGITAGLAAGVLGAIASVEVAGTVDSGLTWAKWAFNNTTIRWAEGRALLWDYGKTL